VNLAHRKTSGLGTSTEWISARFRDERARLDLTQAQVAKAAGVSRNTVVSWEKGAEIPSSALARLSTIGFEPRYILTGLPASSGPEITPEEWSVLRSYRSLSEFQQEQARAMLAVLNVGMPVAGNVVIGKGRSRVAGRDYNASGSRKKKP
jgi:DNA-binding XRE family transcriptional regulator